MVGAHGKVEARLPHPCNTPKESSAGSGRRAVSRQAHTHRAPAASSLWHTRGRCLSAWVAARVATRVEQRAPMNTMCDTRLPKYSSSERICNRQAITTQSSYVLTFDFKSRHSGGKARGLIRFFFGAHLVDNLVRLEVSREPAFARGAEGAAHGAPHLGADARREARLVGLCAVCVGGV